MARMVSGLSQMPPIMASRPASMRLAMAISPWRDKSSIEPISRRYMRTGSSVRSYSGASAAAAVVAGGVASSLVAASGLASSPSSFSMTLTPISESMDMVSSICSLETWSWGSTELISS